MDIWGVGQAQRHADPLFSTHTYRTALYGSSTDRPSDTDHDARRAVCGCEGACSESIGFEQKPGTVICDRRHLYHIMELLFAYAASHALRACYRFEVPFTTILYMAGPAARALVVMLPMVPLVQAICWWGA